MTREEMIEIARTLRGRDRFGPMDRYTPHQPEDPRNRQRGEAERLYSSFYCAPGSEQTQSVYASPILASSAEPAGFPDSLVISAGKDSLQEETAAFAGHLTRSGRSVIYRNVPEAVHGFTVNRTEGREAAPVLHKTFFHNHFAKETDK